MCEFDIEIVCKLISQPNFSFFRNSMKQSFKICFFPSKMGILYQIWSKSTEIGKVKIDQGHRFPRKSS